MRAMDTFTGVRCFRESETMKDLTYYAIMYGGVPMTSTGARMFIMMAVNAGYKFEKCLQFVPDELLSPKGIEQKKGLVKI